MSQSKEIATFAGGCFWCTEAVFKRVKGVDTVLSGYSGGEKGNPTYEEVSMERTGHAEAIQFTYDPDIISYDELLTIFWATHNPTTLNKQGNDIGTQYRSIIFYHSDQQKKAAFASKKQLEETHKYSDPVVTQIVPYKNFYPAEADHKDYYDKNRTAPYCMVIIDPKIQKLMENFKDTLKEEYK